MKRVVDREELRVYWQLGNFWEKLIYIVGWIFSIFMVLSFIVGVIIGIIEA